ncbi:Fic family protein [bacterium]|nr:Fic family protein [bacterium]
MNKDQNMDDLRKSYRNYIINLNESNNMQSLSFPLSKVFPETNHINELIKQLSELKKCLDSYRPLNPAQVEKIRESMDVEYTYNSNKIEGNTLTLQETSVVILEGLTISGKSMKEHLEVINHKDAIDYIRDLVAKDSEINAYELKSIHSLVLRTIDKYNAGQFRKVAVEITGSSHMPPQPYLIQTQIDDFFLYYEKNKDLLHPVVLASNLHQKLVNIHPFIDGNGRTARLLMNFILIKSGYPIVNIKGNNESRKEYYSALEKAHTENDFEVFQTLVLKLSKESLSKYLNLVASTEEENKGIYFLKKIEDYL